MKKWSSMLLASLSCGSLCALPLGNPSEPSIYIESFWSDVGCADPCSPDFCFATAWNVRVGFYGDYVFNRHLERVPESEHRNIDKTELYTNAAYLALNFCERIDLFATLGNTKIHIQNEEIIEENSFFSEFYFTSRFSWSLGARATLWECRHFTLGIEGQYFHTAPRFDFLLNHLDGSLFYLGNHHYVDYSEWQVGLGIAYDFYLPCSMLAFVPYMGVYWSEAHFDLNGLELIYSGEFVDILPNFQSEKLWGYGIGITFLLGDLIGVSVEGRFASEKALYVNGQFRF